MDEQPPKQHNGHSSQTRPQSNDGLDGSNENKQNSGSKKKIIYLIRHAESEENVHMASLFSAAKSVQNLQIPQKKDAKQGLKFVSGCLAGHTDAPLSDFGRLQVC